MHLPLVLHHALCFANRTHYDDLGGPRRTSAFCEEREEEGVWHGSFFPEFLGGLAQGHGPVLMWHANVAKERNCRRPGSSDRALCSSRNAARPRCEQDGQVQWYRPCIEGASLSPIPRAD